MESKVIEIKNYVLTYIDIDNKEVIINSKGEETTLDSKPLYNSYDNAVKGKKKITNYLKKQETRDRNKYWYDKGIELSEKEKLDPINAYKVKLIKQYLDLLLIMDNDLIIREVSISIDFGK